jgi:DnaK suppressor protein
MLSNPGHTRFIKNAKILIDSADCCHCWEKADEPVNEQEEKMTQRDIEPFNSMLLAKQREISGSLGKRNDIVIEKASDNFDQLQLMGERELAIRDLDRASKALRQIRQALSRIASGSYGMCLYCEEDIVQKRLAAVPWAAFCIKCQELIDRNEIAVENGFEITQAA